MSHTKQPNTLQFFFAGISSIIALLAPQLSFAANWTKAGGDYLWIDADSVARKADGMVYYRTYMGAIQNVNNPSITRSEAITNDRIDCLKKKSSSNFSGTWQTPTSVGNQDILRVVCFTPANNKAQQGDMQAQYELGEMYWDGVGTTVNFQEAMRWLRTASDKGHMQATSELGEMYWQGLGVPVNYTEAMRLKRKAANMGNPSAQFNVGEMYEKGLGVAKDDKEAVRWYRQAAHGNEGAQKRLRELGQK